MTDPTATTSGELYFAPVHGNEPDLICVKALATSGRLYYKDGTHRRVVKYTIDKCRALVAEGYLKEIDAPEVVRLRNAHPRVPEPPRFPDYPPKSSVKRKKQPASGEPKTDVPMTQHGDAW